MQSRRGELTFTRQFIDPPPEFAGLVEHILAASLQWKSNPHLGKRCKCGRGEATVRCNLCLQAGPCCVGCMLDTHKQNPFHGIEQWQKTHWAKTSLHRIGLKVHLGHGGEECPKTTNRTTAYNITVVSEYGITVMAAIYCQCNDAETRPYQLLRARLVPVTLQKTQHVITEGALRRWQHDSLISNASALDHLKKLDALTNVTGELVTKVRARSFTSA